MRCRCSKTLLLLAALEASTSFLVSASPVFDTDPQKPLVSQPEEPVRRKLRGRFLHITDIHPDPFYKRNSSAAEECHGDKGRAGYYGAERSDCDSPFTLANATFEWIKANLKDEIDFVVWTGDSARHDNDINHPRSESQIYDLNRMAVSMMFDVFKKPIPDDDDNPVNDVIIPIVPSIGNNDILPHNIMLPGPSSTTRTYLDIWRHFVPEAQRHVFEHGAYFWVEVIPNKLAVFSLNTMYFFSSNAAVDGCDSADEPGFQQFTWLKIQLDLMRLRKMKAMLIGHVPPARTKSKQAWDDTCWSKYVTWLWNYRDVVVGNIYGHMNLDHFMLLDSHLAEKIGKEPEARSASEVSTWDELVNVQAAGPYLSELRAVLSKIPEPPEAKDKKKKKDKSKEDGDPKSEKKKKNKKGKGKDGKKKKGGKKKPKKDPKKEHKKYIDKIGGKFAERYVPIFVGPSVVPNYYPSLRIFEYNITGLVDEEGYLIDESTATSYSAPWLFDTAANSKPKPSPDPNVPSPPPTGSAPGPAYSPQTLSITGYKQLYANITDLNGWVPKEDDDEDDFGFYPPELDGTKKKKGGDKDKDGKKKPKKPRLPPKPFKYEVEYTTYNDTKGYKLKDMSVRSLVKLADGMRDLDVKAKGFDIKWKSSKHAEDDEEAEERDESDSGESDDESEIEDGEVKKGGKKHKKKKGRKHKHKKSKAQKRKDKTWHLFVKRAFVSAIDDDDIDID